MKYAGMTDSDSPLSDSLNSFSEHCDEEIAENKRTIEYHDAPTVTTSTSDSEDVNPYSEFTKINDNPNEGMVIVQMDDGGPRMKRRKATEIVIPIDHVSSSEVIHNLQGDCQGMTDSSNRSSDTGHKSSMQHVESNSDGYSVADETTYDGLHTEPASRQDQSCTPNDCDEESEDSRSDRNNIKELSDSEDDETDSNSDVDTDDDSPAVDNEGEPTPETDSNIARLPSNADYLNIYRKLRDGRAKLEEVVGARDRLGKQILQTRANHPQSSYISLRMYSSLSANYNLRNIGYVHLDSQTARPDSDNYDSINNQQASGEGDIVEVTRGNRTSIQDDGAPVEHDSTSPVCSTRFDFTPAARSKIEGAATACSEAVNGTLSAESGRENPQAKQDSEVRPLKMPLALDFQRRRHHQRLPPIPTTMERANLVHGKPGVLAKSKLSSNLNSATKQMKSEYHNRKQCLNVKPGIPHQLRSVACYHDGKVDVSITGDKRLIPDSEPLNVNITFIHRPAIQPNNDVKGNSAADDKHQTTSKTRPFPVPMKSISPTPTMKGRLQSKGINSCSKKTLPLLKHVQRTGNSNYGHKQKISRKVIDSRQICKLPSRNILPPLRNVPRKMRNETQTTVKKPNEIFKRKQSKNSIRKYENLNWDIVNERAQWPPFNTHINTEASERHNKIFADISV